MSESLVLSPLTEHTATVIFIHGLGQSNITWRDLVQKHLAPSLPNVKWVFPQSFDRPVTFSAGQLRPSWFDIHTLPPGDHEWDAKGIEESKDFIERVIDAEVAGSGISLKRIVLAGFSQGACLSMITALTGGPSTHELGGLVSLSGWIPAQLRKKLRAEQRAASDKVGNWSIPVLWCHGTTDDEIPLAHGQEGFAFLHEMADDAGVCTLKLYEGLTHTTNDEETADVCKWLVERLK